MSYIIAIRVVPRAFVPESIDIGLFCYSKGGKNDETINK